jgi:hypothetical protein
MSVNIGGATCRTLKEPVYLNDTLIKEIYVDGVLVYPDSDYDNLPDGRYVLRLKSQFSHTFSSVEMTKVGSPGGLLSNPSGNEYDVFTRMVVGDVETVIVSTKPIAVYETAIKFPTGDFTSYYKCGKTFSKSDYYDSNGKPLEQGYAPPLPDIFASVGYVTNSDARTFTCYSAYGFNTASSMDGWKGLNGIDYIYKDGARTDYAIAVSRGKTASKGYYDSNDNEPLIQVKSESGNAVVDGRTVSCICGYSSTTVVPVISSPLWAESREGEHWKPFYIAPFTQVIYNNNPPVSSTTFDSDPPTEEADDSWKVAP